MQSGDIVTGVLMRGCCCEEKDDSVQACCPPDGGPCLEVTPQECLAIGGTPQGKGTDCANTECECIGICPSDCPSCPTALLLSLSNIQYETTSGFSCTSEGGVVVFDRIDECLWAYLGPVQEIGTTDCGGVLSIRSGHGDVANEIRCRVDFDGISNWEVGVRFNCTCDGANPGNFNLNWVRCIDTDPLCPVGGQWGNAILTTPGAFGAGELFI